MTLTLPPVTHAQRRVLRALADLLTTNPAPSLSEWAAVAGENGQPLSMPSIMQHRAVLSAKQLIQNTPGKTRSTRVSDLGYTVLNR